MLSAQLLFVPDFPGYVCKTMLWVSFGHMMDVENLKQASMRFNHRCLLERKTAMSLSLVSTRSKAILKVTPYAAVAPYLNINSFEGHTLSNQAFLGGEVGEEDDEDDDFAVTESQTDMLRRKKIGSANKGKIPWNKGITHNEATRLKIKQRTVEALSDPQVRKKMSECYRDRSDECKEKISVSLRHVWAKRLNYPRQREKFYLSWFESIALAAKTGGKDQNELGWDSYAKMADELARQKQEQKSDEVNAKIKAAVRAKKITNKKTKEFSADGPKKNIKRKKCRRNIDEEILVSDDSDLQTKLSKIKKPTAVTIKAETNSFLSWEKLDLEYVKMQNRQKASLADQIQAVKIRREKLLSNPPCYD